MECESQIEELVTLSAAAKLYPRRVHTSTVWRHCRKGVKVRGGGCIRLRHVRVGGQVFLAPGDLRRFFEEVAEADRAYFEARVERPTAPTRTRGRSVKQRARDLERAERQCEAAGI